LSSSLILSSSLSDVGTVDDYFASLEETARLAYERVRDLALAEVPDADQGTSYGMAALKYRGKPLLGFQAARSHLSIFPFSPQAIDTVRGELAGSAVSKGTLRFDPASPLPSDVIRTLVRSRAAEIEGSGRGA
jgi:uncharacterized protein YdhG (YjbR/CyaY superfamily)